MNGQPERIEKKLRTSPSDKKFSILIPTWNNLPYLKLCIESIRKNSTYLHQVIVHVNEGKDGSFEWIKDQLDVDYSFSRENIGICYALNLCSNLAYTDYILYLNDDMYACPGWDKALYDEIEAVGHPYFFISSTAIEPKTSNNCAIEQSFGTHINNFDEAALLNQYAALPMHDWQGATWPPNVVHRDLWNRVGGYSTEFSPGMYSDPDFSMKLWQAGVRLFKGVGKSRVYHFGSMSVKRVVKNNGYYTFIAKWGITSGTFFNYFLRRGQLFDGPLKETTLSATLKIKSAFKQLVAMFKRRRINF